jgi:hypothetical protein
VRIPTTSVIVCIDPIVVLSVPVDSYVLSGPVGGVAFSPLGVERGDRFGLVELPFRLAYGTSVPFHEDLRWWSPSMGTAPSPLDSSTGIRQIQTLWGCLQVVRVGDRWTVSARARSAR